MVGASNKTLRRAKAKKGKRAVTQPPSVDDSTTPPETSTPSAPSPSLVPSVSQEASTEKKPCSCPNCREAAPPPCDCDPNIVTDGCELCARYDSLLIVHPFLRNDDNNAIHNNRWLRLLSGAIPNDIAFLGALILTELWLAYEILPDELWYDIADLANSRIRAAAYGCEIDTKREKTTLTSLWTFLRSISLLDLDRACRANGIGVYTRKGRVRHPFLRLRKKAQVALDKFSDLATADGTAKRSVTQIPSTDESAEGLTAILQWGARYAQECEAEEYGDTCACPLHVAHMSRRRRTPDAPSSSTTSLYYDWNLAREFAMSMAFADPRIPAIPAADEPSSPPLIVDSLGGLDPSDVPASVPAPGAVPPPPSSASLSSSAADAVSVQAVAPPSVSTFSFVPLPTPGGTDGSRPTRPLPSRPPPARPPPPNPAELSAENVKIAESVDHFLAAFNHDLDAATRFIAVYEADSERRQRLGFEVLHYTHYLCPEIISALSKTTFLAPARSVAVSTGAMTASRHQSVSASPSGETDGVPPPSVATEVTPLKPSQVTDASTAQSVATEVPPLVVDDFTPRSVAREVTPASPPKVVDDITPRLVEKEVTPASPPKVVDDIKPRSVAREVTHASSPKIIVDATPTSAATEITPPTPSLVGFAEAASSPPVKSMPDRNTLGAVPHPNQPSIKSSITGPPPARHQPDCVVA